MIVEIENLEFLKIILGFILGFILGILLCTPRTINDVCIRHDSITYCEVSK